MQNSKVHDPALTADTQPHSSDRLARQLIRHLGVAGAARTCRENHWDGVLLAVEAHARSTAQS